ncbi:MAG TPA: DUF952 domain-containing protein [Pirellulales bacterium]|jgi:uncharacterized protein (DUF952 family)|nr:DUF952 domain-containing protein [Pirellulales bacterium]
MTTPTDTIFVFITSRDFEHACQAGFYRPASLAADNFIHASPRNQLIRVANKFYASAADLRLLHIDPGRVTAEIRWEPATGGLYPHIYGPLNMDAVVRTTAVTRGDEGTLVPEGLD